MRALARWQGEVSGLNFNQLLNGARMAITIARQQGDRYQGVVPLTGQTLAECLEFYFQQSEQLRTRIWLSDGQHRAAGLLLQMMPMAADLQETNAEEDWHRLTLLADTLTQEEQLALDSETLLHRLFHQENIRLFDPQPVRFQCRCSRERFAEAIQLLPKEDIEHLISDPVPLTTQCVFCNEKYVFDSIDLNQLLKGQALPKDTPHATRH
jgi:molecular chaperone Hsp33